MYCAISVQDNFLFLLQVAAVSARSAASISVGLHRQTIRAMAASSHVFHLRCCRSIIAAEVQFRIVEIHAVRS